MAPKAKPWFVIARNKSFRPALQHRVAAPGDDYTLCGTFIGEWTRVHNNRSLEILLCLKCRKYPDDVTEILKARHVKGVDR